MKPTVEIYDAIEEVCKKYGQNEEFMNIMRRLVENKLGNNYLPEDLVVLIEKLKDGVINDSQNKQN